MTKKLTITEYVANKTERQHAIYNSKTGYTYKGKMYTEKEFEELLPINKPMYMFGEQQKFNKGENPDKRRIV